MGNVTVPGTSIQYQNPNQLNAAAVDPTTGNAWAPYPVPGSGALSNGVQLMKGGTATPQPGSYDATPPTAPPLAVNKPAVPASDPSVGGKTIPGSSVTWRNPA